jgi:transposase
MQSEETWMELHVLHDHGWSIAALAREFGRDWRTARRYARAEKAPRYRPRDCPAKLTEAQLAHIERRLAGCPNLRVTVIERELRAAYGYRGSYTSLRRRIAPLRPADNTEPVVRFETSPGVQVQGDWTDCGIWPLGDGSVSLHAWVSILGYSRMAAVRFSLDKTRPSTLRAIVRTLDDLGGAAAEILTDRDPALVIGRRADDSPIYAPAWIDTAANLGIRPRACRAYRAKTKGKVERFNREIKEDLLAWLTGQVLPEHPSLADYDAFAERWRREVVATRRHRTTKLIVGEAWATEKPLLTPVSRRLLASVEGISAIPGPAAEAPRPRALSGQTVEVRSLALYAELAR